MHTAGHLSFFHTITDISYIIINYIAYFKGLLSLVVLCDDRIMQLVIKMGKVRLFPKAPLYHLGLNNTNTACTKMCRTVVAKQFSYCS